MFWIGMPYLMRDAIGWLITSSAAGTPAPWRASPMEWFLLVCCFTLG